MKTFLKALPLVFLFGTNAIAQNFIPTGPCYTCTSGRGGSSSSPSYVSPSSAPAVPCQGGTGSAITTITTTASTVCSAATSRGFASVIPNNGTAGTIVAYGTYDGTTPTSTHYNFVLYGTGVGWDTSGYAAVPTGAIQLVAASGTVTITATAIQSPAP